MSNAILEPRPKQPGRWRAAILAVLVHAALFALLWFGVRWQSDTPDTIVAEVWSPQVREAAPRPQPEPEQQEKPEPAPVAKQPPKPKEPPKPAAIEPPVEKPDIALEQEKKRKLKEKKLREEEARQEKKRVEEKRAHDRLVEKEKADAAAKKKLAADTAKKEAAEKKRKLELEEEQRLAKTREEDMRRITSAAGGSGDAPKREGSRGDPGYAQKIGAKIRSNINFIVPDNLSSNAPVEYVVDLLPDGSVAGMRQIKSSGLPGFDEAVRRAIERSQPYPKDKSGKVPSSFIGVHRPKDQ